MQPMSRCLCGGGARLLVGGIARSRAVSGQGLLLRSGVAHPIEKRSTPSARHTTRGSTNPGCARPTPLSEFALHFDAAVRRSAILAFPTASLKCSKFGYAAWSSHVIVV